MPRDVDGVIIGAIDPGQAKAEGRVITTKNAVGIRITGFDSRNNTVVNAYVGTDENSTKELGNTLQGILIEGGASSITIGGLGSSERNLISGNGSNGVDINNSSDNTVIGNYIGTNKAGTGRSATGPVCASAGTPTTT